MLFSVYSLCFTMLMSFGVVLCYPKWISKALVFSFVDQGPPRFVISSGFLVVVADMVYFLNSFAICADQKTCLWVLPWHR